MRIVLFILLFVICSPAANYGVLAVCSTVSGEEYCYVSEGQYRALEVGGRLVIANGFSITGFFVDGGSSVLKSKDRADVLYTPVRDEAGAPYLMFEAKNNLWISDTNGCVTFKYVAGDRKSFSKTYKYVEMDSVDLAVNMAERCRESKGIK